MIEIGLFLQILSTDFEIGHFLRARIIPKAVLYYTGDIVEDDDDDDYDEGKQALHHSHISWPHLNYAVTNVNISFQ